MEKKYSGSISFMLSALVILFGVVVISSMVGCGGGGGDDHPETVKVAGIVDGGSVSPAVTNAVCRFYDKDGKEDEETTPAKSDALVGGYTLYIRPEKQGYIRCYPPGKKNLLLSNYISTEGMIGGDEITGEAADVTPTHTLVADHIDWLRPADPRTRKKELLDSFKTDPDRRMMAEIASQLFKALWNPVFPAYQFNGSYGGGGGGEGGPSGGDGGGVGGDAGDGG